MRLPLNSLLHSYVRRIQILFNITEMEKTNKKNPTQKNQQTGLQNERHHKQRCSDFGLDPFNQ